MAYSTASVTAYCDTGFSMINTPANASVLASSARSVVQLEDINCLPLIGKKSGVIRVKVFNGLPSCDYVKLVFRDNPIDSFWIVTGYEYVSGETVDLSIVLDGFLTCGGTSGISALSGYVVRHHTSSDEYGKYNQNDEMLVPSQNLIFRSVDKFGLNSSSEQYWNIVLSTINLLELGTRDAEDMGLTYGDTTSGEAVTVPQIPQIPDKWKTTIEFGSHSYEIPGAFAFDLDGTAVVGSNTTYPIREGIARARSLGVEGGIIAMYSLPKSKFDCEIAHISITLPIVGTATLDALVTKIKPAQGSSQTHQTSIKFNFKNVNNKRAIYGGLETVKVVSMASGESADYEIEDLYSPTNQNTSVVIKEVGDGRAHGKPYFFPEYFMDTLQDVDNLLSSISGLEWQNVPIVFQYSSGEGLTRTKFFASKNVELENMIDRQATSFAGTLAQSGMTMATTNYLNPLGAIRTGAQVGYNLASAINNIESENRQFERSRALEKKQMLIDSRVTSPEIAFPVSEAIRDFVGNGVLVGFVTPTDHDIDRFDKILTMYGYKDAGTELTLSDLTVGLHFSYIEASGVQIQTSVNVDKTIKEMAEEQISVGIRIWKERPNFALYSSSNR